MKGHISSVALSSLLARSSQLITKKHDVGLKDDEIRELADIGAELDRRKSYNTTSKRKTMEHDKMRELGLLGLLARCSVHVTDELRECIEMAMDNSPQVASVEIRLNRIDFVTKDGTSSFETIPPDRYGIR